MDINLLVLDFNKLDKGIKNNELKELKELNNWKEMNDIYNIDFNDLFGIMFQYPNTYGNISIHQNLINKCKENKVLVSCIADLLSLVKIITPRK